MIYKVDVCTNLTTTTAARRSSKAGPTGPALGRQTQPAALRPFLSAVAETSMAP